MKHERNNTTPGVIHKAILILTLPFCSNLWAGLHQDMLSFEQRYIPVLLLTAQSDAKAVEVSAKLITQWNEFKQKHAYAYSDDSLWDFDLVNIERAILDAQRMIQSGQFSKAYETLSKVRFRFVVMRERHQIEFYIDELIRFDPAMKALLYKLQHQRSDNVYMEISEARRAWKNIMQTELNFRDYDLSLQQVEYLRQCLRKGEQILTSMQEHFLAAEYGKLEGLGTQMHELYDKTYAIFARN